MDRKIYIYFDDIHTAEPVLMGLLTAQQVRGHEVFSFEFAEDWLRNSHCHLLDPDLQFFAGRQYLTEPKSNFGLFLDSSPDRWGRVLLDRRESQRAKSEQRQRQNLQESDYLLGVFDESRMGAAVTTVKTWVLGKLSPCLWPSNAILRWLLLRPGL